MRSCFLSLRQGKNELTGYVQELRTLMAAMQSYSLPETVYVTVFMVGIRYWLSQDRGFSVPSFYF